jgi:hypothetical protein
MSEKSEFSPYIFSTQISKRAHELFVKDDLYMKIKKEDWEELNDKIVDFFEKMTYKHANTPYPDWYVNGVK